MHAWTDATGQPVGALSGLARTVDAYLFVKVLASCDNMNYTLCTGEIQAPHFKNTFAQVRRQKIMEELCTLCKPAYVFVQVHKREPQDIVVHV